MKLVDLDDCGGLRDSCDVSAMGSTKLGGGQSVQKGCLRAWTLNESAKDELQGGKFACSALLAQAQEARDFKVSGLSLSSVNFTLKALELTTVAFTDAVFRNVHIALEGPIVLRIIDSELRNTRVELASDAELELEHTESTALMVAGPKSSPAGKITAKWQRLSASHLQARAITLESVELVESQLNADVFQGVDVQWALGYLSVGEGLLASSYTEHLHVRECSTLTIVDSEMNYNRMACDGLLRVYDTLVYATMFDGSVQTDRSRVSASRFGVRSKTEINAWDTALASNIFCGKQERLTFGGAVVQNCARCESADALDVCALPETEVVSQKNACVAVHAPPECSRPLPTRDRLAPVAPVP
jgi:hypothetical protein